MNNNRDNFIVDNKQKTNPYLPKIASLNKNKQKTQLITYHESKISNESNIRSFHSLIHEKTYSNVFSKINKSSFGKIYFRDIQFKVCEYPNDQNLYLEFKGIDDANNTEWNEDLFKKSFDENAAKSVISFINTTLIYNELNETPTIFFGIHENKKIHGIKITKPDHTVDTNQFLVDFRKDVERSFRDQLNSTLGHMNFFTEIIINALSFKVILLEPKDQNSLQDSLNLYVILKIQLNSKLLKVPYIPNKDNYFYARDKSGQILEFDNYDKLVEYQREIFIKDNEYNNYDTDNENDNKSDNY